MNYEYPTLMKTIEVAVELLAELGEWSEPVRVRYTEDPFPMLEFQTVDGQDDTENGSELPADEGCCGRPDEPHYHRETLDRIERVPRPMNTNCETCGGSGVVESWHHDHGTLVDDETCPTCGGTGLAGAGIVEVELREKGYGTAAVVVESELMFVDMDHEVATSLEPGRYLVVRIDGETK